MLANHEVTEYLAEIRNQVCSRCVEKPEGGPPCAPLGKNCGIELHLPELIDSVHQVHSNRVAPYLEHNRHEICEKCAFLHSSICPCPMDYLAVLIVEAIETVDRRRAERGVCPAKSSNSVAEIGEAVEDVRRLYTEAAGSWKGCDWPTEFGESRLNLQNCTVADAELMAEHTQEIEAADWRAAAEWLRQVEHHAKQAASFAALAVAAAEEGKWKEAHEHAQQAAALEFATGRPIWHAYPLAWQPLEQAVEAIYRTQSNN